MKTRHYLTLLAVAVLLTAFAGHAFSQEIPAPGTTIDKNNYKKYMSFFPPEWADLFETGVRGLVPHIKMVVEPTKPFVPHPKFVEFSAKNKGKYSIGPDGDIVPKFDRNGLPFPGLQKSDKDFLIKFMWNVDARYKADQSYAAVGRNYTRRIGEKERISSAELIDVNFTQRLFTKPAPVLPSPTGVRNASIFNFQSPDAVKNTMTLSYRYIDRSKPDETYLYLPAMRRVLRAESSQRSVPIAGDIDSLDDLGCFSGNIYEWTYTLIGEQKVVALADMSGYTPAMAKADVDKNLHPWAVRGWQVVDSYIIDLKPKNPKYPQSKKRVWFEKATGWPLYSVSYDRPGKAWKVSMSGLAPLKMNDGVPIPFAMGAFTCDVQFGIVKWFPLNMQFNGMGGTPVFKYEDLTPASLLSRAK